MLKLEKFWIAMISLPLLRLIIFLKSSQSLRESLELIGLTIVEHYLFLKMKISVYFFITIIILFY